MKYHQLPQKWRAELLAYSLEYIRSGFSLPVREYARSKGIPEGTIKHYVSPALRDWVLDKLLFTISENELKTSVPLQQIEH